MTHRSIASTAAPPAAPLPEESNNLQVAAEATDVDATPAGGTRNSPREALEWQLLLLWRSVLDQPSVGIRTNFFALGGTRALADRLLADIARVFGSVLSYETFEAAPTVAGQAAALLTRDDCFVRQALLPIQTRGTRAPFFLVHRAAGHLLPYRRLVQHLDGDLPVYGLQMIEQAPDVPVHTSIEEMAEHHVAVIRRVQPVGPYRLGGSSFGGVLAFEIARRLERQGARVSLLAEFDTDPPNCPVRRLGTMARVIVPSRRAVQRHWRSVMALPYTSRPRYLAALGMRTLRRAIGVDRPPAATHHPPRMFMESNTVRTLYAAFYAYHPMRYHGRLTLFSAQRHRLPDLDLVRAWKRCVADVDAQAVPGTHLTMLAPPHVKVLARLLSDALRETESDPGMRADG